MKRLFLTVVAMLSMTLTFAENENMNVNSANNVEAYNMNVNILQMARALELTDDQVEAVTEIHKIFCDEMMVAARHTQEERKACVNVAVKRNLSYMNYVLDYDQYKKYRRLLSLTLRNRGLR